MDEQEFRTGTPKVQVHADAELNAHGNAAGDAETASRIERLTAALRQADIGLDVRDKELRGLRLAAIRLYEVLVDQEFPAEQGSLMTTVEIMNQLVEGGRQLLNNARDTTNQATQDAMRNSQALLVLRQRSRNVVRHLAEALLAVTEEPGEGKAAG